MIDLEQRVLLKHYLEEGMPVAVLVLRLRIDRYTIQRWIAGVKTECDVDVADVRYPAWPERPGKLETCKPLIEERFAQDPELIAARLFVEIQAVGYTDGMSQMRAFVRRTRPTPVADPLLCFETPYSGSPRSCRASPLTTPSRWRVAAPRAICSPSSSTRRMARCATLPSRGSRPQ